MASKSLSFLLFGEDVSAGRAFKKVAGEAEASGAAVKKGFGAGSLAAVGGLAVGLGLAVKAAGDFQLKTNVLVTAAGETAANLGMVRKGIENIATSTGTAWQSVTDGMYQVEKAGYRGADALKVVKAAAQGAKEEGANLATVVAADTSVMASYHLHASDAVMVTNEIKTAAGEAKTTMEAFAGSLSTVLPVASANKISFADVAGSLASLTQHGTSADEATQELSNTIRNLAAPNAVAKKEMAQLGISFNDVALKVGDGPGGRGLAGTLNYLSETVLKKMGPSGTLLLSTFNSSKAAAQSAQIEYAALDTSTQKLAKGYRDGTLSLKDWHDGLKKLPADQASLAGQWATTESAAKGFQSTLRAGLGSNQTYTDAVKKMTGGVNGLNTTLQLTGDSMVGTNERIKRIAESAKGAEKDVSGWASTQKTFNVQLDMLKQTAEVAAINIGTKLLPALSGIATFANKNQTAVIGVIAGLTGLKIATMAVGFAMEAWAAAAAVAGAAVSGLETLYVGAMIAMDSAMGPVGLAIGAVTLAVGFATKGFGLFGGSAHKQVKPVEELTAAIKADGDAVGNLTKQQVNHTLSSKGAYDAGLKLGISQDVVLAATLGNIDAQKKVKVAVDAARGAYAAATKTTATYGSSSRAGGVAVRTATSAQLDAKNAADQLAGSTGALTGQINASKHAADNEKLAMEAGAQAAKDYALWLSKVPHSVRTEITVDTSTAYQQIQSIVSYANSQHAVIHVSATNPVTGASIHGQQVFASGTDYAGGGSALVGEQGPERVILPQGARVISATRTRMGSGSDGAEMHVHIHVTQPLGTPDSIAKAVVPALANAYRNGMKRP